MVFEKVRSIISNVLDIEEDKISLETSISDELEADSLDLFQIINDLEDEFDVKIEDAEGLHSVSDVVKVIEEQKN